MKYLIFKQILVIDGWGISCEIALIWISLDSTDDQSALVQVMAWCRQAAIHYLRWSWSRSRSPYGVTRPHWVNSLRPRQYCRHFAADIYQHIFFDENFKLWTRFNEIFSLVSDCEATSHYRNNNDSVNRRTYVRHRQWCCCFNQIIQRLTYLFIGSIVSHLPCDMNEQKISNETSSRL